MQNNRRSNMARSASRFPCFKHPWLSAVAAIIGMSVSQATGPAHAQSLSELGYVEKLWLESYETALPAKIDTGAKTSSINAPDFEVFKKNGKKWVRFTLETKSGKKRAIKKPVARFVRIRRAGVEAKERPIIKLKTCLGGKTQVAEFSLADRSEMNYQAIVGRALLRNRFLVNPAEAFLASGRCEDKKGR